MSETRIVEKLITDRLIAALLAAGYTLGVNDGEDTTVEDTANPEVINAALRSTDEDWLLVNKNEKKIGWIRLIYGNGIDLISDYTVNIEETLKPVNDWINRMEATGEIA